MGGMPSHASAGVKGCDVHAGKACARSAGPPSGYRLRGSSTPSAWLRQNHTLESDKTRTHDKILGCRLQHSGDAPRSYGSCLGGVRAAPHPAVCRVQLDPRWHVLLRQRGRAPHTPNELAQLVTSGALLVNGVESCRE